MRLSFRVRLSRPEWVIASLLASAALASPGVALANGLDSAPDNGILQLGRGSAWVALADDPMAAYMNPAAMSFQSNGVYIGADVMIQNQCFSRKGPGNSLVSPGSSLPAPGATDGPPEATCITPAFPSPALAAVFRPTDRFAIGIAVLPPHTVGGSNWPETVDYTKNGVARTEPAPNRYLATDKNAILIYPTISVSYAITPEFSIGGGFIWGIATADFTSYTESLSPTKDDDFYGHQDVKARVKAQDFFVPGFVLGLDWKASDRIDIGAWYHWSDAVNATSDLTLTSQNFLQGGALNTTPCKNKPADCNVTQADNAGSIKLPIPMEAKVGFRYHHPLSEASTPTSPGWVKKKPGIRDPLTQDRFDIETDLTWANNSALDTILVRFGSATCQFDPSCTNSGIAVKGTPGSVPVNGDLPHQWLDVLGIRVGGDVNVVPGRFALRAGGFFESKGQPDEYLNVDFPEGWKLGFSGGATVRVGPVDIHAAYQHVFYGTLDNGGNGKVHALSGDATTGYRSQQAVNGGSLSASMNEIGLGGAVHF